MVNSSIVNSTSEEISKQTRKRVGGNQIGYLTQEERLPLPVLWKRVARVERKSKERLTSD